MTDYRISFFAAMLAAAGIPLYIHLPRFASVELGVGLGAVGTVLIAIRILDLIQDPLIGWSIDRWPQLQPQFAALAGLGLAVGFPLLFSIPAGAGALIWLTGALILLFSAYSLGMILLYGRSATLAQSSDPAVLLRQARSREAGMLAGVVLAVAAPSVLVSLGAENQGYRGYGFLLGSFAAAVLLGTRGMWRHPVRPGMPATWAMFRGSGAGRLLLLALVNSLPVAITSTLFLFFVEDKLLLSGMAGPLLLVFFISAFAGLPVWYKLSQRIGPRATLLTAMPLTIAGFICAALIDAGNLPGFALICVASGAALGADMLLLPAMFSIALSRAGMRASEAFGIWSFAGKLALALAAFALLPLLESYGFSPGNPNGAAALTVLTLSYSVLPCVLKIAAIALVWTLPTEEHSP